jgi:hypothetical protein
MSWKWIAVCGAGLGLLLGVVLFLVWLIQGVLFLTSGDRTTAPPAVSAPPGTLGFSSAGIQPAPALADPRLAAGSPGPSSHPMTRGMSRAARAALTNELGAAMSGLRPQLERCPDQHLQRAGEVTAAQAKMIELVQRQLAGGGNGEMVQPQLAGGEDQEGATELPTIMTLEVETYDSQVKIVDAALAMPGSASDAFVACARQVLRGQIIAVPAAPTGQHLRVPVDLGGAGIEGQPQRHGARRRR